MPKYDEKGQLIKAGIRVHNHYHNIELDRKDQLNTTVEFFAKEILAWREQMLFDDRFTAEDIAKYDKHFGII